MHEKNRKNGIIGSTFLTFLCIFWIMPVFIVLWNSFKNKNSINASNKKTAHCERFFSV